MDNQKHLPPLPASDPESVARNKFDGYYNIGSRRFWKDADISLTKLQEHTVCSHDFTHEGSFVKCRLCNAGYIGVGLSTQNGKLLINGVSQQF